jgi:hypothetical protein
MSHLRPLRASAQGVLQGRRAIMLRYVPGLAVLVAILCAGCSRDASEADKAAAPADPKAAPAPVNALKDVYFGNLHVHTRYSFDGYTNGSVTTPDDAYRWAKGESIPGGGGGGSMQIKRPLDWYVVSDHSEYLGVFPRMEDPASPLSKHPLARDVTSKEPGVAFAAFGRILQGMSTGKPDPGLANPEISKTIWQEVVQTADKHYAPGKFTTFAGYEWTSNPGQRNLHRVVLFARTDNVPALPFSSFDSEQEEMLWKWMDEQRSRGTSLLAIPHNGNASDGLMFPLEKTFAGSALAAEYAATRMRNEPVYEITQIKGTSETMPSLSPNDEFAGFEIWDYTLSTDARPPMHKVGGYARDAFLRGLKLEAEGKGNPFKYGVIGDSDTHNSASSIEEDNYTGKFASENMPEHRFEGPPGYAEANKRQIREFSSGGLAAVWAESNTREALYAAIERKETYATSGPRMKLRVFAGYDFAPDAVDSPTWIENAYARGVPMGGNLASAPEGKAPVLLIRAAKDAEGANLDRLQVVKGWVKDGKMQEKIYDVAASGDRGPDASGKLRPVGNTVEVKTATYANTIGSAELATAWTDPDFDPAAHAFYYVRLLEIPTPRWSTYDAVKLGVPPRKDLPAFIQERAWSSPIWYSPAARR